MLYTIAITPKSEDKYVLKVFNWSEFHLSEMTFYKIHTLGDADEFNYFYPTLCPFLNFRIFCALLLRKNDGKKSWNQSVM